VRVRNSPLKTCALWSLPLLTRDLEREREREKRACYLKLTFVMLKMLYYFFYISSLFDLIFDALQTETDFLEAPENDALRVRVEHR